jgi:hypothetical protein
MNARTHQQRINFLALKSLMGSITPEERKQLEWLTSFRVTETCGGSVIYIEPHPMSVDEWKAHVRRSRGESDGPLQADTAASDASD